MSFTVLRLHYDTIQTNQPTLCRVLSSNGSLLASSGNVSDNRDKNIAAIVANIWSAYTKSGKKGFTKSISDIQAQQQSGPSDSLIHTGNTGDVNQNISQVQQSGQSQFDADDNGANNNNTNFEGNDDFFYDENQNNDIDYGYGNEDELLDGNNMMPMDDDLMNNGYDNDPFGDDDQMNDQYPNSMMNQSHPNLNEQYENQQKVDLHPLYQPLQFVLIESELGRLGICRVSEKVVLCSCADKSINIGILKRKVESVANYLRKPFKDVNYDEIYV